MRHLILIVLLFSFFNSTAQNLEVPTSAPSPTAGSLGLYGDHPMNLYTGTPSINIPLYNISKYNVGLDISLSYNGTGVRVNDMPGIAGQNWSLNAGGVITRQKKDLFDDYKRLPTDYGNVDGSNETYGFMYQEARNAYNVNNLGSESSIVQLGHNKLVYQTDNTNGIRRDIEPDIFTFNFMGKTGKFYMNHNGEYMVSSESNLKVIINQADRRYIFDKNYYPFEQDENENYPGTSERAVSKFIYKITIIDDAGVQYIFGNTDNSIEYGIGFFAQYQNEWYANSWFLTKVVDRFNRTIYSFDYDRGDYIAQFSQFQTLYEVKGQNDGGSWLDVPFGYTSNNQGYTGTLLSPVYLKKIDIIDLSTSIDFRTVESKGKSYSNLSHIVKYLRSDNRMEYGTYGYYWYLIPYVSAESVMDHLKWKKLTNISGLGKRIRLNYNDTGTTGNNRLFLENLIINEKEKYTFDYNTPNLLPDYVPERLYVNDDHWGFPKNKEYNSTNYSNFYNIKESSSITSKYGSLSKITFPTKGTSEFVWELHDYGAYVTNDKSNLISSPGMAGGLRIKEIRNNDDNGDITIKRYHYKKNYINGGIISSGVLANLPKYYWQNFTRRDAENTSISVDITNFSRNSIVPLSNYSGSHIGYSEVTEEMVGNGFTVHKFSSNEDPRYRDEFNYYSFNPEPTPYQFFSDRSQLRGKELETGSFDQNRNEKVKVVNDFGFDPSKFVYSANINFVANNNTQGYGVMLAELTKLYFFDNTLTKSTSTETFGNGNIISEQRNTFVEYPSQNSYGNLFLRSTEKDIYSKSSSSGYEFTRQEFRYNFDFTASVNTGLTQQHTFPILETKTFRNSRLISTNRLEYGTFNGKFLPKYLKASKGANSLETQTEIIRYDENFIPTKVKNNNSQYTNFINAGQHTVFIVSGSDVIYPEAQLYDFIKNNIKALYNNNGYLNNSTIQGHHVSLRDELRGYNVLGFNYDSRDRLIYKVNERGQSNYFEYDYFSRKLLRIRDENRDILQEFDYQFSTNN